MKLKPLEIQKLIDQQRFQDAAAMLNKADSYQRKLNLANKLIYPVSGLVFAIMILLGLYDLSISFAGMTPLSVSFVDSSAKLFHGVFEHIVGKDGMWFSYLIAWAVCAVLLPVIAASLVSLLISAFAKKEVPSKQLEGEPWQQAQELAERCKLVTKTKYSGSFSRGCFIYTILIVIVLFLFVIFQAINSENEGLILALVFAWFASFIVVLLMYLGLFSLLDNLIFNTQFTDTTLRQYKDSLSRYVDDYKALVNEQMKEAEAERKALEAKQKATEAKRVAKNAEASYQELKASGSLDNESIIKAADEGSPSACLYLGKKMYNRFVEDINNNALLKREIEDIYIKISNYLFVPKEHGNLEAEVLSISLDVISERDLARYNYKKYLQRLRNIKESEMLPEYANLITRLISKLVDEVNQQEVDEACEKMRKEEEKRLSNTVFLSSDDIKRINARAEEILHGKSSNPDNDWAIMPIINGDGI